MVKVRIVMNKRQQSSQGIHILNPTKQELKDAKERVAAQGFRTVWIHKKKGK